MESLIELCGNFILKPSLISWTVVSVLMDKLSI